MTCPIIFITIHPQIIEVYRSFGVFKAAETAGVTQVRAVNLRDFAADKHGSVDDTPYGGGDGMVMRADCLGKAMDSLAFEDAQRPFVIYTSPSGKPWTHGEASRLASVKRPIVFICGRFAGVDQRFLDTCVDAEYSVGDVVLAGGELPSMIIAESILRLQPGVLGHADSASDDSFGPGMEGRLEYPSYTKPADWRGQKVPEVLMSGNHSAIAQWRASQSVEKTRRLRPDLLSKKSKI